MHFQFIVTLCALLSFGLVTRAAYCTPIEPLTLRVALYPYVPNRLSLFQKIEAAFESQHPGVNVELVDDEQWVSDYYVGGLQKTQADVYEVDTILLADVIQSGKISPVNLPAAPFAKNAIDAVTQKGSVYGVPHWQCGNFLFYRKSDFQVAEVRTWEELNRILKQRGESLLVDFKGASTLGEWYLTALSALYGVAEAQHSVMSSIGLDELAVDKLKVSLGACSEGQCRSSDLHHRTGYYARAFVAGEASTYIGYSESMHYGLQYLLDNCTENSGCLSEKEIAVRALPAYRGAKYHHGIGWVDALTIDASLEGAKKRLAEEFIHFVVSVSTYKMLLEPEEGAAPRYLLPARTDLAISGATLYPALYSAHEGSKTGNAIGLNEQLRQKGELLDCALPMNPDDVKSMQQCRTIQ